jgi:SAM-dependent methyltransferase
MAFDDLQYRVLRKIAPAAPTTMAGSAYEGKSKIAVSLGPEILRSVQGKVVIDFGCGDGVATLDLARHGAKQVVGVDILQDRLDRATAHAEAAGLGDRCTFTKRTTMKADVVISLDAFEHFGDPGAILNMMEALLAPDGYVMASFGPTWYHPLGGHLFSVFPWSHLVFSEAALVRWRSDIRSDGATRFSEVEGGLNRMTITRFERIVAASKFKIDSLETVPIGSLRPVHFKLTREFTTAIVRVKLVRA